MRKGPPRWRALIVACVKAKEKTSLYDWFVVEHTGFEPVTSTMRM